MSLKEDLKHIWMNNDLRPTPPRHQTLVLFSNSVFIPFITLPSPLKSIFALFTTVPRISSGTLTPSIFSFYCAQLLYGESPFISPFERLSRSLLFLTSMNKLFQILTSIVGTARASSWGPPVPFVGPHTSSNSCISAPRRRISVFSSDSRSSPPKQSSWHWLQRNRSSRSKVGRSS